MGFSTAGSALVVFIAAFIAVGTMYTSGSRAIERFSTGQADQIDRSTDIVETHLSITEAVWNDSANDLTVRVANGGDTTLSVRQTTLLVDGQHLALAEVETKTVEGRSTDVWRPGETLLLEDTDSVLGLIDDADPDRVKVVTAHGVAAVSEVTVS